MTGRREFLKNLAKGAAYAAPVIYTLSTPRDLMAIVTSGMVMLPAGSAQTSDPAAAPWSVPPASSAPWDAPSPWSAPPPGIPSPKGDSGGNE